MFENLIESINELNIKNNENENIISLNNNSNDTNNIENKFNNLYDDVEIKDCFQEDVEASDNFKNEDIIGEDQPSRNENIEDINIYNLLEDKNRLSLGLLDRVLKKISLDNYNEIIKDLKMKYSKKRDKVSGDSDDEKIIKKVLEKSKGKKNVISILKINL